MRRLTCVFAVALTAFALPRVADACSCVKSPSAAASAKGAHAVFEGKVISSEDFEKTLSGTDYKMKARKYEVQVLRTWKGMVKVGESVTIESADNSAACGRTYELNTDYLIYANASDQEGYLHDGLCSRTTKSADAAEDFEALGPADGNWQAPADTVEEGGDDGGAPTEPSAPNPFDRSGDSGTPAADDGGPAEGDAPAEPPPGEPSSRGCSMATNDGSTRTGLALVLGLGLVGLGRRRRTP
jgi:MYXO-CTERM domain-containing protein